MAVEQNTTYRGKQVLIGRMDDLNQSTRVATKANQHYLTCTTKYLTLKTTQIHQKTINSRKKEIKQGPIGQFYCTAYCPCGGHKLTQGY